MEEALCHYGILGQKWGVRRYQNADGTWTTAGKERYGDDSDSSTASSSEKSKSSTGKKVAIGVAATTAVVAGTVLTAWLVKKYGSQNVADVAEMASAGEEAIADIFKSTAAASTPISQIPATKVDTKAVLEKAIEKTASAASTATTKAATTATKAATTATKAASSATHEIPQSYSFETLMGQNNDLLKQMYADLLS